MDKLCKKYNKKDVISGILIAITLVIPKFFRNIESISSLNSKSKNINLGVVNGSGIFGKKILK